SRSRRTLERTGLVGARLRAKAFATEGPPTQSRSRRMLKRPGLVGARLRAKRARDRSPLRRGAADPGFCNPSSLRLQPGALILRGWCMVQRFGPEHSDERDLEA